MPKFAANLSLMFSEEESLLDRFAAAREAGFSAVEYMFPYEAEADAAMGTSIDEIQEFEPVEDREEEPGEVAATTGV